MPQNDNQTARFGVHTFAAQVFFSVGVRNGGDYGLRVDSRAILRYVHLTDITVKFWGSRRTPRTIRNGGTCSELRSIRKACRASCRAGR